MGKIKKEIAGEQISDKQIVPLENKVVNFNAETLIAQAIEKNVAVETMEKLLAMRKELKAEWSKEQFDKAMAKFQAECPVIEKKKKVSFGTTRYAYAPLEEIVAQVKELLSENGFSYTFDTAQTEKLMTIFCNAKHKDGHTESSKFELEIDTAAKMNRSQQYGSALTYGKRYAFCNAFGILTGDEDNDAQLPKTLNPKGDIIDLPISYPQPHGSNKEGKEVYFEAIKKAQTMTSLENIQKELTIVTKTMPQEDIDELRAAWLERKAELS